MVSSLFDIITEVISGFGSAIVGVFENIITIFYNAEGVTPGFTLAGQLLLIGFGISLVFFALRFVIRLIRLRG